MWKYYHVERPVSAATVAPVKITIFRCKDPHDLGAPIFVGSKSPPLPLPPVPSPHKLATLTESPGGQKVDQIGWITVPINELLKKDFRVRTDEKGNEWHIIDFTLRITAFSADTKYELINGGRNRGACTLELV